MHAVLLMVHVLLGLTLIGLVLIQQGRGADAGAAFGSGASGSVFGSRGPTTFLTRVTAFLAAGFFMTSLTLAVLSKGGAGERQSVIERLDAPPALSEPLGETAAPAPATASDVPALPSKGAEGEGSDLPPASQQ